jgi:hypothetical protein
VWALEEDIEHVLAHRDPKDWYVFEAASWALAERRMPTARVRQLWLEPLPAAIVAERLAKLPVFASVSVDELFRLAGAGRQSRHETGQVLSRAGVVPDGLQALLDGQAEAAQDGKDTRPVLAPATIAFEAFLQNRPAAEQVRATSIAVRLLIDADELGTLLADSTALVEGLFRTLVAVRPLAPQQLTLGEGIETLAPATSTRLSALEKAFVLHRLPVFSAVSAEEVLHLGGIARDLVVEAGHVLADHADPPAVCVVLSGEAAVEVPDQSEEAPITLRDGEVVGLQETLAGVPLGRRLRVVRGPARALRVEREDLFDLLGQRPVLLQQLLGTLLGRDATTRVQVGPRVTGSDTLIS